MESYGNVTSIQSCIVKTLLCLRVRYRLWWTFHFYDETVIKVPKQWYRIKHKGLPSGTLLPTRRLANKPSPRVLRPRTSNPFTTVLPLFLSVPTITRPMTVPVDPESGRPCESPSQTLRGALIGWFSVRPTPQMN